MRRGEIERLRECEKTNREMVEIGRQIESERKMLRKR